MERQRLLAKVLWVMLLPTYILGMLLMASGTILRENLHEEVGGAVFEIGLCTFLPSHYFAEEYWAP